MHFQSAPLDDAGIRSPSPRHEHRARLNDIAREAGVSLATVDRALHHRSGVSDRTLLRVQQAQQRLSTVHTRAPTGNRALLLCFLLPAGDNSSSPCCAASWRRSLPG
ncbi:LacI family DNA-binding transcriptional regulator [Roseateles sp. P5_E7]